MIWLFYLSNQFEFLFEFRFLNDVICAGNVSGLIIDGLDILVRVNDLLKRLDFE